MSYDVVQPEIVDFQIINRTSQEVQYFDVYVNILKVISQSFVHLTLLVDSGNGNFDLIYLNRTFNICELLANRKINVIMDLTFKVMSQYVEVPKRCPLLKVK